MNKSFMQLASEGLTDLDAIDDYVDRWHESPAGQSLHDFLGMKWDEYGLWVRDPDFLPFVVEAHRERREGEDALEMILDVAKRDGGEDAQRLIAWLREIGRVAV